MSTFPSSTAGLSSQVFGDSTLRLFVQLPLECLKTECGDHGQIQCNNCGMAAY